MVSGCGMGKPGIIAALAGRFALDTKMHVQHTLNVPLLTLPNNCDEHKIRFKLCRGIEVVGELATLAEKVAEAYKNTVQQKVSSGQSG